MSLLYLPNFFHFFPYSCVISLWSEQIPSMFCFATLIPTLVLVLVLWLIVFVERLLLLTNMKSQEFILLSHLKQTNKMDKIYKIVVFKTLDLKQ